MQRLNTFTQMTIYVTDMPITALTWKLGEFGVMYWANVSEYGWLAVTSLVEPDTRTS